MKFLVWSLYAIFVTVIVLMGCQNNNPATPPAAGPTELEGIWTGYSDADTNNPDIPKPNLAYSFTNNNIVVSSDSCSKMDLPVCVVELYRGTFSVDTSASPKTLDIHITQSGFAKYQNKTIYAVYTKNANILAISANGPGTSRPLAINDQMSIHLTE